MGNVRCFCPARPHRGPVHRDVLPVAEDIRPIERKDLGPAPTIFQWKPCLEPVDLQNIQGKINGAPAQLLAIAKIMPRRLGLVCMGIHGSFRRNAVKTTSAFEETQTMLRAWLAQWLYDSEDEHPTIRQYHGFGPLRYREKYSRWQTAYSPALA